jgi:hypothetical protein
MSIHAREGTSLGPQMPFVKLGLHILLSNFHVTILGHSQHKVIPKILTRLPKCVDIAVAITHIDPLVMLRHPPNLQHTLFPDMRFSSSFFAL